MNLTSETGPLCRAPLISDSILSANPPSYTTSILRNLTESIGRDYADDQFNKIVEFMSGRRPDECPTEELNRPGK